MALLVAQQRYALPRPPLERAGSRCLLLLSALLLSACAGHPKKPETPAEEARDEAKQEQKAEAREEKEREDQHPCERPEVDEVPVIDDTREMLEETLCTAALWVDGLFGESGDIQAARRTHGFVEINNYYSEFENYESRARMRVEVDLPTMENRLSAFVGRENDDEFVRGRNEVNELRSQFPTLDDENEWLAGFGYSLPGRERLQTKFRVGVRSLSHPRAFVQTRLRYNLYSDNRNVIYVGSTPFWNSMDGFGITNNFDFSHVLSPTRLLRWYSVGTVSEKTEGLNWRHSLIHYQNLKLKRALAYEAFIRGETDEPEPLYEYGARVLFRHPLLKRRLYAEWALGYSWPRIDPEEPREGSANIGLGFELPFGQKDDD
jgi:hypothetical protein